VSVNYESGQLAPDAVRRMFDRIAPFYDAMNRTMTAGLDRRWRRLTAEAVVRPGDAVLDACCGTGDLAIAAARAGGRVTGLDFSEPMLERARRKAPEVEWIRGDLLELPFADASFDSATVGFGVRNVDDLQRALSELRRVLGPGGRLVFLTNSMLAHLCTPDSDDDAITNVLVRPLFDQYRTKWPEYPGIEYHISHGHWIRILRENGFVLDALHELRPGDDAQTHHYYFTIPVEWARRWPGEDLWEAHLR